MMTTMKRTLLLATAALAAACATSGGGGGAPPGGPPARVIQADHAPLGGRFNLLGDEIEISYYKNGLETQMRGEEAARSGNLDQARAEWAAAANVYASFADKFPNSDWALRIRYDAGILNYQARQWENAAVQLLTVHNHKFASKTTKALAAKLLAATWQSAAASAQKAGKLEPMRFVFADQRGGKPPEPRVPPGEWKKFMDAVDLYLASADADPDTKKPAAERQGQPPAYFAEVAAEVAFANDNMLDAQRRFETVLSRWPDEAEYVQKASALYLQTFLVLGDAQGHEAAVAKLKTQVEGSLATAQTEEQKASYKKILADLENANAAKQFGAAQKLLEAGKFVEAAQAFEALAADPKGGDAPNALHNAAIAYDKANQKEKSAAVRQRIVAEFPNSTTAPMNQIQLALRAAEQKKYDEALKHYRAYLEKWPADRNRCIALQNVASTLDQARKRADAAEAYVAFGTDLECQKGDPNTLVKVLYRGGALYEQVKNKAKAKEAFRAAATVQGVTDVVAKSQQDDAKNRAKR